MSILQNTAPVLPVENRAFVHCQGNRTSRMHLPVCRQNSDWFQANPIDPLYKSAEPQMSKLLTKAPEKIAAT